MEKETPQYSVAYSSRLLLPAAKAAVSESPMAAIMSTSSSRTSRATLGTSGDRPAHAHGTCAAARARGSAASTKQAASIVFGTLTELIDNGSRRVIYCYQLII